MEQVSLLKQTFKNKITKERIKECFVVFEIVDSEERYDFICNLVDRGYKVEGAGKAFGNVSVDSSYVEIYGLDNN